MAALIHDTSAPDFSLYQGLGNAYLPAAILVLAGSLARPSAAPKEASRASSSGDGAAAATSRETKGAFYRKVLDKVADSFAVRA